MFEKALAVYDQDEVKAQVIQDKADRLLDNCPDEVRDAIDWAYEQDESGSISPFMKEGLIDSYFEKANSLLAESETYLEEGKKDSDKGDSYGLVTVIYSMVLFLLGIIGIFKSLKNRWVIFWISIVLLVFATVYMCTIPLPAGFSLLDYLKI